MMNMKYISLALAALLMAACATHESSEMGADEADKPQMKLAAVRSGGSTMRAADNIQTAAFDADELIRGYISFTDGGSTTTYDGILLTTMAADDNNVNPLHPEHYMVGPSDRTATVSAYALYPSWLTKESTSFTVSADQRETGDAAIEQGTMTDDEYAAARGYKGSDLMWGTPDGNSVSAEVSPIEIKFSHKMAKVIVNAQSDGSVGQLVITGVKLHQVKRKINFTATTGALGAVSTLGDAGDILLSNYGACLLPPQDIGTTENFIEVTATIGNNATEQTAGFKLGSALTLQSGHQYTFTLDIGMQGMTLRTDNTILKWEESGTQDAVVLGEGEFQIKPIASVVYNGTDQHPSFSVVSLEGTFNYNYAGTSEDNAPFLAKFDTPTWATGSNVGDYLVIVQGKLDGTYAGKVGVQNFSIAPRPVTITAKDAEIKVYDETTYGTTTTGKQFNFSALDGATPYTARLNASNGTDEGLLEGHYVSSVKLTPSNTSTVSTDSKLTPSDAVILDGSGASMTSNYNITYADGTLTITKRPVTLTAKAGAIKKDDVCTYGPTSSGKTFNNLTCSSYTTYVTASSGTNEGLVSGHYVNSINLKPSTTSDVTTNGTLTPSAAVIKDASGNVVTSKYNITYATGTLTVSVPTTLAELKTWVKAGNTANTYYGYYVNSSGGIHSSYVSGDIGRVAYYQKSAVDTYSGASDTRILVLDVENVGTLAWKTSASSGESDYNSTSAMNGLDFCASHNNSTYPAAQAAYNWSKNRPDGSTKWFLPSYAQWSKMLTVAKKDGTGKISSGRYWSATEQSDNAGNAVLYLFANEFWSNLAKNDNTNYVRACFAY